MSLFDKGWKFSDPYSEAKQAKYVKDIVEELKKVPRIKIPPTTTQCASTQAILDRDPSKDEEWQNRPLPQGWLANPGATSIEEAIGARSFTPQEIVLVEDIRRSAKNTIGQSDKGSVDQEKRELGIHAFTYSPPAQLTKEEKKKIVELSGYTPTPMYQEEKPSALKRLGSWLTKSWKGKYLSKEDEEIARQLND